jgi:hypothetical protein
LSDTGQITYQGQTFNLPGVYGIPNTNGLQVTGSTGGQDLVVLVGQAANGPTGVLHPITGPTDLQNTYGSGPIVDAYSLIARYTDATNLAAYALGTNTQSSLTLLDASSQPSIVGTSNGYGVSQNSLGVSISGTAGNLTAQFVNRATNYTATQSGLGPAFTVAYTGNGAAVLTIGSTLTAPVVTPTAETTGGTIPANTTVNIIVVAKNAACVTPSTEVNVVTGSGSTNSVNWSITSVPGATSYDVYASSGAAAPTYYGTTTSTSGTATHIPSSTQTAPTQVTGEFLTVTVTGQTDGSGPIDVALTGPLATVAGVVNYVGGQVGYTCSAASTTSGSIPSTLLDPVTSQTLTSGGYTATADKGAVIAWLNSLGQATFVAGSGGPPAPTGGVVLFSGATSVAPQTTDWTNFGTALESLVPRPQIVVFLTSNPANIQTLSNAVTYANQINPGLNLVFFCGGGTNPTATSLIQIAQSGSNFLGCCAANDFYDYNASGTYTLFPAYMLGAIAAGQAAANPAQPFTNQPVGVLQLNTVFDANTTAYLIQNGVMVANYNTQNIITWVQGTTMDNNPQHQNNLFYVEPSVRDSVFTVLDMLSATLSQVGIGLGTGYTGANTQTALVGTVNNVLARAQKLQLIAGYTPVSAQNIQPFANNPTWLNITLTLQIISPINGIITSVNVTLPTSVAA